MMSRESEMQWLELCSQWTLVEAEVVTGNWEGRCGEDDLALAGGSVCNNDIEKWQIIDALACSGDVDCRLASRSWALEMRYRVVWI